VREAIEAIDRVLEGLPSRVKRTFLLNRLEGMPQQAIAELLGVSLATVERDLRRAFVHCLSQTAECP
jgi:DNA-directed RNA polymerase specialized sigma subunit, sigma24 homolog